MASEASNQKRKRGRPPNASKPPASTTASQTASTAPVDYDADADEESRPRKRGRPKADSGDAMTAPEKPRKRGRPSAAESTAKDDAQNDSRGGQVEDAAARDRQGPGRKQKKGSAGGRLNGDEAEEPPSRKKRGRPSLQAATENAQQAQKEPQENGSASRQRRGRRSAQREEDTEERPDDEPEPELARKKRGRAPRQAAAQNEEPQPDVQKNSRVRRSLQDMSPSGVQNGGPATKEKTQKRTKQNGEEKRNSTGSTTKQDSKSTATSDSKKKRGQQNSSTHPAAEAKVAGQQNGQQTHKKPRRRSGQGEDADADADADTEEAPPSPQRPYPHVAPRVHRIRQSVIEDKWSPLTGASLTAASTILQLANRPILQGLAGNQQRRAHTAHALRLVAGRVVRKMRKGLPFPPASMPAPRRRGGRAAEDPAVEDDAGREGELDFERVLDARQALERQLDPALHAVELLRREKSRLERELERDYQALKTLELGARAQAREQRGLLKKAHALAPEATTAQRKDEKPELEFKREATDAVPGALFKDLDQDVLQPLALQLSGHVDSIRTNLDQARGIVPQIGRSRAVLRDMLLRHLDEEQYEQVVLG